MSYLYVGVGGSGAKLLHALVHLTAAGLLPAGGRELMGLLVDSDESNGNVAACKEAAGLYTKCQSLLSMGSVPLFRNKLEVIGPWSPVRDTSTASLETIFDHERLKRVKPDDAGLMELLFSTEERKLTIFEGFRGRPAIGSTIFGKTVHLDAPMWKEFYDRVLNAVNQNDVSLLLAGSVFGGSGAAGVPTICHLLQQSLEKKVRDLRVGLVLFLPFFTYEKLDDKTMQADPEDFAIATAEALKYYDEGRFLDICEAIYVVGDRYPAKMPVPAVGKAAQRNPPHFVELVAGLGAIRFMSGAAAQQNVVSLAGRKAENSVTWADLPTATGQHRQQIALLQQFILFAVSYRFLFFPYVKANLSKRDPLLDHLGEKPRKEAIDELAEVDRYLESFLDWLAYVSTPERVGVAPFVPGLVNIDVFAKPQFVDETSGERTWKRRVWQQVSPSQFHEKWLADLLLNVESGKKPNARALFHAAAEPVNDHQARGTGRLVRAIYEACRIS